MLFALLVSLTVHVACSLVAAAPYDYSNSTTIAGNSSTYKVGPLPGVNFNLSNNYAGEVPIPGKSDDSLFFWYFETEVASKSNELIIWLNGGPGCSSMTGLALENGPFLFPNTTSPQPNPYSWTKLANVLYIDQPVGTGYSFGSDEADDNDEVTQDFFNWLKAFYGIFPKLKSKRTYISGESWAGIYIPYFTDSLLRGQKELSINLQAISIGDPTYGNFAAQFDVGISTFLNQSNSILNIPSPILDAFFEGDKRCQFDKVLAQATYPPNGPITIPGNPEGSNFRREKRQSMDGNSTESCDINPTTPALIQQSIDGQCYGGCATWSTAADYLFARNPCFDNYNINYTCATEPDSVDPINWFNRPDVRKAIHAENKTFESCNATIQNDLAGEAVMPPAYTILPRILDQLPVHIYSGSYDFMVNHIGTELVLQNMTWNGAQGFQHNPSAPFVVDGQQAGTWCSERGLSYHLIDGAGHEVPVDKPAAAFAFMRDFVLGDAGYDHTS